MEKQPGDSLNAELKPAVATASTETAPQSSGSSWYMVSVLLIFYICSFIDRQILALLIGPMKRDLQISDTMIGLLSGFGFAILYTIVGIPIGRLADRVNRKKIIAAGLIVWSLMAACCGLARNAVQLFAARMGVGLGEAALSPAAYSMITDAFPKERLGRAFSIYNMGIAMGSGIALLVGGIVVGMVSVAGQTIHVPLLGDVRAWQFVFIVTGAPGLILPLLLLTVREPKRRGLLKTANAGTPASVPFSQVIGYMLKGWRFYLPHFLSMAMMSMLGYAVGTWLPEVVLRTYDVSTATTGKVLGVSTLCINTLGIFLAGRICDSLTKKGYSDAPIWVCFGTSLAVLATSTFPAFMPSGTLALAMMCFAGLPFHGYVAMGPMAVNQVTPNQMRAQVSSFYLFTVSFLGMGAGPALVPLISDHILHNPQEIRWGLAIVVASSAIIAAVLQWHTRKAFRQKVAESATWNT
jgi:MFS family permease